MQVGRRFWIGGAAAATVALPATAWWMRERDPAPVVGAGGELRRDPRGVLDLLEGFSYTAIDRSGRRMSDGYAVPPRPDGMACFEGEGGLVLLRNHEIPQGVPVAELVGRPWPAEAYDPGAGGAVTRLVLDPNTLTPTAANLVLAGTSTNCAGGATSHGWVSCEEDPRGAHGYAFLCDPAADRARPPVRIDGYGKFRHEAAAFRDADGTCYLTEDRPDGCLYRFTPADPAAPFGEGHLEALAIGGRAADTAGLRGGEAREIRWVPLVDPTPREDTLRLEARAAGAARVKRGEGACLADGALYFCATTGGPIEAGQIFRLDDEGDGGTLEVYAASEDRRQMDMPDNLIMDPRGLLWFVEDGRGRDCLRAVRPGGEVVTLGRNVGSDGEITGVCFSPDGRAMFVNLQEEGLTLRVDGPFDGLV